MSIRNWRRQAQQVIMSCMPKIITANKKAKFDYEVIETYEAGVVLTGPEVKSIKLGHISIKDSFATIKAGEIFLTNSYVSPYQQASNVNQEPNRSRKLLLKKSEIQKLVGKMQAERLTLIPTAVLLERGMVKVELALGKGRKQFDKREAIKKREQKREIEKSIKERGR